MDGFASLILFSFVMGLASFGAGMLPLVLSLSQSHLRLLSTVGMGVLVGTSLIVIIPEGIETLYSVSVAVSGAAHTGAENGVHVPAARARDLGFDLEEEMARLRIRTGKEDPEHEKDGEIPHDHDHDHAEPSSNPHKWVGASLIAGFVLMYLIDVIPEHTHNTAPQTYHISVNNLRTLSSSPSPSESDDQHVSKTASLTLGLVIHSAADGIALGASSTSANVALEFIIFFAIVLHKMPAAFGMSAVLLRSGLTKRQARARLIVFSLAAPVGAIVTYVLIGALGGSSGGGNMQWWTGVLLLFSGGTFLYVAMHTMQEQAEMAKESAQKSTLTDVLATVAGMLFPLVTQVGHHHH